MEFIDALRGAACLAVVLFHAFGGTHPRDIGGSSFAALSPAHHAFSTFVGLGYRGVALFLCLSGLCLFLPCVRKQPIDEVRVGFAEFMKRRSLRILPPYYAALIIFMVLIRLNLAHMITGMPGTIGGPRSVLLHLSMLYNLSASTIGRVCGAFWSLAVEYQTYLAFPAMLWVVRRYGLRGLVGAAFAVSVGWGAYAARVVVPSRDWTWDFVYHDTPLDFCWFFVVGMLCAALIARPEYARMRAPLMTAGFICLAPAIVCEMAPVPYYVANLIWGVVFGGGIVAASCLNADIFHINPLLRALYRIGVFSYSIYLIHQPLVAFAVRRVPGPFGLFIAIASAVAVGYLFHIVFERPFMNTPYSGRPAATRKERHVAGRPMKEA